MERWPCTFTQLWFHDMPFLLLPDPEADDLSLVRRSYCDIRSVIGSDILDLLISRLYIRFAIRMRQLNREMFRSIICSKPFVYLKKRPKFMISVCRNRKDPPPSLDSIPSELRLKIFDYVASGAAMNVVGYWHEGRDAFYFKERGKFLQDFSRRKASHPDPWIVTDKADPGACPIALICKRFHQEALEAYFTNLVLNFKSASPSNFGGDMSNFASAGFRDRLKQVVIADGNKLRRSRICSAFKNARIEYNDKYASGARKGAYYFS